MAISTSSGSGDYGLFDELAEEFAERYRRGERPSLQEYIERCPEMGDEIRELFPALVEVEQAEEVLEGSADCTAPPPTPFLRQIGDYRVIREVGRGGMGVVYEAEQISLGRRVALKVMPRGIAKDRNGQERFRREARAAARLHHTNIVPVFQVGQDGEVVFYAMQFIQGQGLDVVIDELAHQRQNSGRASAAPLAAEGEETTAWPAGQHAAANRCRIEMPAFDAGSRPHRGAGGFAPNAAGQPDGAVALDRQVRSRRRSIQTGPAHQKTWPRPAPVTVKPLAHWPGHSMARARRPHPPPVRPPPCCRVVPRFRRLSRRAGGCRSSRALLGSAGRPRMGWPTPMPGA